MSPRVPLLLLSLLLATAAAHAEVPVTEERPLAPTLGTSADARVVATNSGFLAFWKTHPSFGGEPSAQVARLSPDGDLERRATAWDLPSTFRWYDGGSNGEEVLLAGISGPLDGPLALALFSKEGDFLKYIPLPFGSPVDPSVTSNGDGFLVTFAIPARREVLAIPVARDGAPGDAIVVGPWNPGSQWTSPAAMEDAYFVAHGSTSGHVLSRLENGRVERVGSLTPPFPISQVRIASWVDRILVVVTPTGPASANDPRMRAAVFDRDLQALTDWFPLDGGNSVPRVEPTSSGWMVAASGATGVTMIPVSRDGVPGEATLVEEIREWGLIFDAAARANRASLVWTTGLDGTAPDFRHNAVRLAVFDDGARSTRAPAALSLGPAPQIHPAAAHANGVTLAAWVERNAESKFVVKTRRFDSSGAPLSPLAVMPWRGESQLQPRIASDGSSFFVVWAEGVAGRSGVYGARMATDGTLLDPESISLFGPTQPSSRYRTAAVDWSGSAWIVVSSDERGRLVARRVGPGGTVLDAEPVSLLPESELRYPSDFAPALECNGSECLVAWHGPPLPWECRITCPGPPPTIRAARIASDLRLLDAAEHVLGESYDEIVRALRVDWSREGQQWLVSRPGGTATINRDGSLAREMPSGSWNDTSAAVAEGTGWRLVWSPYPYTDLFHGWSPDGSVSAIRERWGVGRTPEREWDALLVDAPHPVAFFLRESTLTAGSPRVFGEILDEGDGPFAPRVALELSRIGNGKVRLSWSAEPGDTVRHFNILRLVGTQWRTAIYGVAANHRSFELDLGAARSFKVIAETSYGPVDSNAATLESARRRAVGR